jgi:plasmid maintenance system antidote protein VapI
LTAERAISASTAILLGERFATSAEFWMNLQAAHDPKKARRDTGRLADRPNPPK